MKNWCHAILFLISALLSSGCVEPYEPAILTQDNNYLVVEGYLNIEGEPSHIRLSHTARLADAVDIMPVTLATVSIESYAGNVYPLQEVTNGEYVSAPLELDPQGSYRLRIRTSPGDEYLSAYVTAKQTPDIDSLNWVYKGDGVQIFVTTHDPEGKARYYRWEFEEDWETTAPYEATIAFVNEQVVPRRPPPPMRCWSQQESSNLLLGSSAKLSEDLIYQQPLHFIPRGSSKIGHLYSLLAKQYAISREAFEYFQQMEKNTEALGSFFDPQPTELRGNIQHVNNASEPVIGFFTAGSVKQKRIFIKNFDLPAWGYEKACRVIKIPPDSMSYYAAKGYELMYSDLLTGQYVATLDVSCYDCSVIASPVKPVFWE